MLVPVTDSMFVPGTLSSSTEVLIDIGTGYYLKKTIPGAVKILDKKVCGTLSRLPFAVPSPSTIAVCHMTCVELGGVGAWLRALGRSSS